MNKCKLVRKSIIIICIILLSSSNISIADTNIVSTIETSFERISASQAEAEVDIYFQSPRTIDVKMELQKSLNTINYTTTGNPLQLNINNRMSLSWIQIFDIENEYFYRVKFQITDTLNGIQNTVIRYEYL